MQLVESWCQAFGNPRTEHVSIFRVAEEIRNANSIMIGLGDTFIVDVVVCWMCGDEGNQQSRKFTTFDNCPNNWEVTAVCLYLFVFCGF